MYPTYPADILQRAQAIKLLICDVDGVLSNGQIYLDGNGNEYKAFHTHDGQGFKLLQQAGIALAIISSRCSGCVTLRMQALHVTHVYQGVTDKLTCYRELLNKLQLHSEQTAYVGDDLPDIAPMQQAGLSVAVANAVSDVKAHAHWHSTRAGGDGAVREVCELLLLAQHQLSTLTETYLA